MSPRRRRLTPDEAQRARARAERANLIVSMAVSDREFMKDVAEAYEESERGEGMTWDEFRRQEELRRLNEV